MISNIRFIEIAQVAREMLSQECLLRTEIEFWREMIDRKDSGLSGAAFERMRQALALAERKLQLLEPTLPEMDYGQGGRASSYRKTERRH